MENLIINLLTDDAFRELKEMERNDKIKILNESDVADEKARRELMLREIDNYTYENILKSLKNRDS